MDTGKMLLAFLAAKRISKTELGNRIGRSALSVLNYTRNKTVQTGILLKICHATRHNFFQDIANTLPTDYTVSEDKFSGKDLLIAQLQEENKVLKIQNDVLMKVRG